MTSIAFFPQFKCWDTMLVPNDAECVVFCQCLIGVANLMFEGSQKLWYFLRK